MAKAAPQGVDESAEDHHGREELVAGAEIEGHGDRDQRPAVLLAANHLLWLDPFIIIGLNGARALANSWIQRIPVLGYIVGSTRNIFIDNKQLRAVPHSVRAVGAVLREGDSVIVFPE